MTLTELKQRCAEASIQYAYQKFDKPVQPPHLVGHTINSDNFGADNLVYAENNNFQLELTTLKKDLELQNKIKNQILYDVFWEKTEDYISTEEVYNTSYFFEIKEE